ncbi:MAG: phosphoribosyl-ATP diphosphatase [Oscillospiraceae bacterium]|jgi:phosphoribosyl-ATP pyrophosphohydrolase|nr:phosphoribosyl-ATP diphosphatase [Oscillospiraceae bacterium]
MTELTTLYAIAEERKRTPAENSYSSYLFGAGLDKILKKIGEEAAETIIAAKNLERGGTGAEFTGEVCDLLYHLVIALVELDVPLGDIQAELARRAEKQGNLKKTRETDKDT